MKVTLIQMDIAWLDADANRRHAQQLIEAHAGSDLYVLPEMFNTGFAPDPTLAAEPEDGPTLAWMREMAARMDAAIAGSVATRIGTNDGSDRYTNRLYFVLPDGTTHSYDKHHLFGYGGENRRYTPGDERVVVSFRGVRFMPLVCYDLRFPTWSRNRPTLFGTTDGATDGNALYDCLLYVASWPTSRLPAWRTLLHARAIENQSYALGVNRVGTDPACDYSGGTFCVDPYGRTAAECEAGKEEALTVQLDMARLKAFRAKFPVLADRD